MEKAIDITFDGEGFKPNSPVDLPAGSHGCVVMVETLEEKIAWFKARFPNVVGVLPKEDAEVMMRIVDEGRRMSVVALSEGDGNSWVAA